jgi:hypothetical protein
LISVEAKAFPGKDSLGVRISRKSLLLGVLGEYRSGSSKVLVLGKPRRSGQSLKIKISHPSIDVIWVSGPEVQVTQKQLSTLIGD